MPAHPSGAWVHDLDPFLWRISGEFGLRWYGLAYLAGIAFGAWLLHHWRQRDRLPLRPGELQDFVFIVGLSMVLGGRLGYCLFYQPELWITFDGGFPWWGVLRVMDGGMASHGGILGLAAGTWWWAHRHGRSAVVLADAVAVAAPIGVICGRLANFINGELWGRPCDPGLPWAVVFPAEAHPRATTPEALAALPARHPSPLYAAVLEGVIPFLIALPFHARHRRAGLSMALILALYAIGRFIGEFWREPDLGQPGSPGHDFILGFMTKGQALTVPILAIAALIAWWAWRRGPRPEHYRPTEPDQPRL